MSGYEIVGGNESCPLNMILAYFMTELKYERRFTFDTEIGRTLEKFVKFWEFVGQHLGEEVTDKALKEGLEYSKADIEDINKIA